ncbi:MAG: efflux RND transporter permease subunit, partial [Halieaceae bacterium]
SSVSSSGVSIMTIKLQDTLPRSELERSWSEIRDAIGDAQTEFPAGVPAPVFDNDQMAPYVQILAITAADDRDISPSLMNRLALDFADSARNFPGTRLVDIYGEPREEIRVAIDESAMIARGIGIADVSQALSAADTKMASGRASGAINDLLIEVSGDLDTMERVRQVIVRALPDGRAVRIADIATVSKTEASPPPSLALAQGKRAILVAVSAREGLQVDAWSRRFSEFVDSYREQAPAGINLITTYDQSLYTTERLSAVVANLGIGIALVLLVLLATLGWRAAVVVAFILPLCSLLSISVLAFMDMAIHQMSLTGLVVALGLLVDGSIVMTDQVRKQLLRGHSPIESISLGVRRLRIPLLSSTATTILAFMPMAILPGVPGDFLGSIAIAVVVMLGSSLLLALTITPVLAAWLLPGGLDAEDQWWDRGLKSGAVGALFTRSLDWSLRRPVGSIALALALPVAGFLCFPTLTAQFFPGTDRDQFHVQVKLPDGRSIQDTRALVMRLDEQLRNEPMIRRVDWTIGESAPGFYYNMIRSREGMPSWAEALVMTTDVRTTDDLIRRLQHELDSDYPAARILVRGLDQGPPVNAPIEVEVRGPNLSILRTLGEEFRLRMERIAEVTHTNTSLVAGAPKVVFHLDENKLRLTRLQASGVANALNAALSGQSSGEVLEGTARLPVRARLTETDWGVAEQIGAMHLPVRGTNATGLPGISLATLGNYEVVPASSSIARKDGQRINIIQAFIIRGVLPEEALKQLAADLEANPIELPVGYSYRFGGNTDERAGVVEKIMAPMGLIIALLIATVVMTFNSWRLAAIAFFVCICSMGLSLLALAIFRYPFGVQALIGVIGSIGVSINAAIIIITALQLDDGAMNGGLFAIRRVVMDSSRHIVSTTITTFGGFLPLILSGGGFWPPFAMAIAGGVLLSTIVSFYLVPPMFLLANRLGRNPVGANLTLPGASAETVERMAS